MVVVDVDEIYEKDSASNLANYVCAWGGELPGFVGVSQVSEVAVCCRKQMRVYCFRGYTSLEYLLGA